MSSGVPSYSFLNFYHFLRWILSSSLFSEHLLKLSCLRKKVYSIILYYHLLSCTILNNSSLIIHLLEWSFWNETMLQQNEFSMKLLETLKGKSCQPHPETVTFFPRQVLLRHIVCHTLRLTSRPGKDEQSHLFSGLH